MSAQLSQCSATTETNQFIRPIVKIDTVSAAPRLAFRGSGILVSKEQRGCCHVSSRGMSVELVDELLVVHDSLFDSLSSEDVQAMRDLYTATPHEMQMTDTVKEMTKPLSDPVEHERSPSMLINALCDAAAGSPATGIAATCPVKEALSLT